MPDFFERLEMLVGQVNRVVLELFKWLLIATLAIMTGIVVTSVLFRYVLNDPLPWSEEIAKFFMVWLTFLAAPVGLSRARTSPSKHPFAEVRHIANNECGCRTPTKRRSGGVPLGHGMFYKLLSNPFYAGYIRWNGQLYPGKHEPIVTLEELERVQVLMGRSLIQKPQKYSFACTGLMSCGNCGLAVTAEHKTNRQGHQVHL